MSTLAFLYLLSTVQTEVVTGRKKHQSAEGSSGEDEDGKRSKFLAGKIH